MSSVTEPDKVRKVHVRSREPGMSRVEWLWCWFLVASVSAAAMVIILAGTAKADIPPGHVVTDRDCFMALEDPALVAPCRALGWTVTARHHLLLDRHDVTRAWSIRPCTFEDASGGPLPCGWNIGSLSTGNGEGRAYWVDRSRHFHYVWGRYPRPVLDGWAHWAGPYAQHLLGISARCWVTHPAPHRWKYGCP